MKIEPIWRYNTDTSTDIIKFTIYLSVSQGSRVHSSQRRDNQPLTLIQMLRAMHSTVDYELNL